MANGTQYCTYCGTIIPEGAVVCPECGEIVEQEAEIDLKQKRREKERNTVTRDFGKRKNARRNR